MSLGNEPAANNPKGKIPKHILDRSVDWSRSVMVDSQIDDELVRKLAPRILSMRQESNAPITVGIDSPGGSLAALDVLLGLLIGPDQNKANGSIVTVATNRAYSAAALLLTFGDYSVALPHAHIVYHDVRYSEISDLTSDRARNAAKSLQALNDLFALRLARKINTRLIWIYIRLLKENEDFAPDLKSVHSKYVSAIRGFTKVAPDDENFDFASFATRIYAHLLPEQPALIDNVIARLARWIGLGELAINTPTYRDKGGKIPGILDGVRHLYSKLSNNPGVIDQSEEELKLLLCLIAYDLAKEVDTEKPSFPATIERAVEEFTIINAMNDQKHIEYAFDLMFDYKQIFFPLHIAKGFNKRSQQRKQEIILTYMPYARLFWQFCVLLCRELLRGDNVITPENAQILGLIDEVSGGGAVMSVRDYFVSNKHKFI